MTDLLLSDNPPDAIDDIAFTTTVGADDARDVVVEVDDCFISKTFESFYF